MISPPPIQRNFFSFLMFFNVNLGFAHVYTPPKHLTIPPQFQIPRNNPATVYSCSSIRTTLETYRRLRRPLSTTLLPHHPPSPISPTNANCRPFSESASTSLWRRKKRVPADKIRTASSTTAAPPPLLYTLPPSAPAHGSRQTAVDKLILNDSD